ncbi:MAG: autorepressor SdpR family transcription factor [Xenococcaceae cyanobacterium MO_188.B29]|nr:autorepressor SdpR family transcription factor [Xenococcaceae cyanobacterium MO_188.B29]
MSNEIYKALSDPTRRRILELLRDRDLTAGELATHFNLAKSTLSRHFVVLKNANLIHADKNGTTITYHLNLSVLEEALLSLMSAFKLSPQSNQLAYPEKTSSNDLGKYYET